eukprot:364885-Chlamydomonas_euryale.AAC.2
MPVCTQVWARIRSAALHQPVAQTALCHYGGFHQPCGNAAAGDRARRLCHHPTKLKGKRLACATRCAVAWSFLPCTQRYAQLCWLQRLHNACSRASWHDGALMVVRAVLLQMPPCNAVWSVPGCSRPPHERLSCDTCATTFTPASCCSCRVRLVAQCSSPTLGATPPACGPSVTCASS